MNDAAICVDSLRKTYRDGLFRSRKIEALGGVSFNVEHGSIFGLLGPNGAGKTTFIKVLLGLVKKTGGDAALLGYPAGHRGGRRRVGYLPENHRIPRHLTGNAALVYYGGLSGLAPSEVKRRRDDLLRRVGLADWGKTSVRKYSKGMLQRLGLAQAMLHDPDVLILDEPTDGVDPVGRSEMRGLLQSLKDEGKTIFINSHLLQEVELVCDRVAILVQGELQRVGTVEEITERDAEEITFAVGGEAATARAAIDFAQPTNWLSAEGGHTFTVAAADQQAINRCIDALRTARVDILSMTRERTSLEDAFLDIVARQRNEAADAEVIEVTPKEGESPA